MTWKNREELKSRRNSHEICGKYQIYYGINNNLRVSLGWSRIIWKKQRQIYFARQETRKKWVNQALMRRLRVPLGCLNLRVSSQISTPVACLKFLDRHGQETSCMVACSILSSSIVFSQESYQASLPIGTEVVVPFPQRLCFLILGLPSTTVSPFVYMLTTGHILFCKKWKQSSPWNCPMESTIIFFFQG